MLWPVGALSATQAPLISVACMTHHTCMTHPLTQACVDQGEVVMMGEQYQPDVLHPAWAPGAVAPLPSFHPDWFVQYNMQYGSGESNADFFTAAQPRVRAC